MFLTDLTGDSLGAVAAFLGPRSLKQLCRVCRVLEAFCGGLFASDYYPRTLIAGAARHLAERLVSPSTLLHGGLSSRFTDEAAQLAAKTILATVSGSEAEPDKWSRREMLNALYPSALHLSGWALAPYALEWCARNEHQILETGKGVRRELLALLHSDALERLEACAKETGWGEGILATSVSLAARRALTADTFQDAGRQTAARGIVMAASEFQGRNVMKAALGQAKFVFGLAVVAALNEPIDGCPLSGSASAGLWASLDKSMPGNRTEYAQADLEWRDLAGYPSEHEGSARNPRLLLEQCADPRGTKHHGKKGRLRPPLMQTGLLVPRPVLYRPENLGDLEGQDEPGSPADTR